MFHSIPITLSIRLLQREFRSHTKILNHQSEGFSYSQNVLGLERLKTHFEIQSALVILEDCLLRSSEIPQFLLLTFMQAPGVHLNHMFFEEAYISCAYLYLMTFLKIKNRGQQDQVEIRMLGLSYY